MQPPGWLRCYRFAEERRAEIANETDVIHSVQDVERIHSKCDHRAFIPLCTREKEVAGPAEIEIGVAWPLQAIAAHARRAVVRQAVAIVVPSRDLVVRLAGVRSECHTELKVSAWVDCAEQNKAVALIEIRSRPFALKIVVVSRE